MNAAGHESSREARGFARCPFPLQFTELELGPAFGSSVHPCVFFVFIWFLCMNGFIFLFPWDLYILEIHLLSFCKLSKTAIASGLARSRHQPSFFFRFFFCDLFYFVSFYFLDTRLFVSCFSTAFLFQTNSRANQEEESAVYCFTLSEGEKKWRWSRLSFTKRISSRLFFFFYRNEVRDTATREKLLG